MGAGAVSPLSILYFGPGQQRNVMTVDRSVVTQAEFFKNHAGQEQILHALFDLVREFDRALARDRFDEPARLVVQSGVSRVRHDVVQVARDRANIFRDRPFVVVEHHDEPARLRSGVVERFITDSAGEGGVACDHDHVFVAAAQIAADRHAEAG